MITHDHPNPLAVLDAVIADMRASGDTGHVENLLQARADFAELVGACGEYFGPMDDPSIGWVGSSPSHRDIFKCERCGQEHLDCSLIPHTPYCRAVRLVKAMKAAGVAP